VLAQPRRDRALARPDSPGQTDPHVTVAPR
jgi:hypothetical protein